MGYVCKTLSEPDLYGLQTCTQWQVQESNFLGLPNITPEQAKEIFTPIAYLIIAAVCYKLLARLINSFIKK